MRFRVAMCTGGSNEARLVPRRGWRWQVTPSLPTYRSSTRRHFLSTRILARLLRFFRMRRAADMIEEAAAQPRDARIDFLLDGAPPGLARLAIRHRYVALGVALNVPGNVVVGGGGGIMLVAGLSGVFAPLPTALAVVVAVSPVPLAIMLFGA